MAALDIYDRGNGSVLVAWSPIPGIAPQSFNVYVNGVLNQNVPAVGGLQPLLTEAGVQLETESGQVLDVEQVLIGASVGSAVLSGLQAASYANNVVPPAGDGSHRPESLPPVGKLTDSLTYTIRVVPVVGGVEVAGAREAKITPQPQSALCVTPMPRGRFPFPSTPGGY